MQQLFSIWPFYKPFILWSFGINTTLSFMQYDIIPILIAKLLMAAFLWYIINETHRKRKLAIYKKLEITTLKLFALLFSIDLILSVPFLILLQEFM